MKFPEAINTTIWLALQARLKSSTAGPITIFSSKKPHVLASAPINIPSASGTIRPQIVYLKVKSARRMPGLRIDPITFVYSGRYRDLMQKLLYAPIGEEVKAGCGLWWLELGDEGTDERQKV